MSKPDFTEVAQKVLDALQVSPNDAELIEIALVEVYEAAYNKGKEDAKTKSSCRS